MSTNMRQLFDDILDRGGPNDNLVPIVRWTLFAQPLPAVDLYFAILFCTDQLAESTLADRPVITKRTLRDFILTSSKGLIELTTSVNEREINTAYQFIHESVREYFLECGLQKLDPNSSGNSVAASHAFLARACMGYIELCAMASSEYKGSRLRRSYPLERYARDIGVFFHAEEAEQAGISQDAFLDRFPLAQWLSLTPARLGTYGSNEMGYCVSGFEVWSSHNTSLLLALVSNQCSRLTQRALQRSATLEAGYINTQSGRFGTALHAAVACGNVEIAKTLLASGIDINARCLNHESALGLAMSLGNVPCTQALIEHGMSSGLWSAEYVGIFIVGAMRSYVNNRKVDPSTVKECILRIGLPAAELLVRSIEAAARGRNEDTSLRLAEELAQALPERKCSSDKRSSVPETKLAGQKRLTTNPSFKVTRWIKKILKPS